MSEMTYQDKILAIMSLDPAARLRMVERDSWVVEMPSLQGKLEAGTDPESAISVAQIQLTGGYPFTLDAGKRVEASFKWEGLWFSRQRPEPKPRKPRAARAAGDTAAKLPFGDAIRPSGPDDGAPTLPLDTAAKGEPKRKGGAAS